MTGSEWRRRWPRIWPASSALAGQPGGDAGDAGEQVASRRLVAAALGRLTPEHQDVLRECYFRGSSVTQAAKALQIPPDTVKSRMYYALRALRLAIEELRGVE